MNQVVTTDVTTAPAVAPIEPGKQIDINGGVQIPLEDKKPKEESLSPHFAALARKEKAIRQQIRQIEAEREALKSREAEIESSVHSKWKERLSTNPWDTLIEAGLTPDQITQVMLNQPRPEAIEIKNLKKELESYKSAQQKSLEEFEKKQIEQARQQVRHEINSLVNGNDEFEAIQAMNAHGLVLDYIDAIVKAEGIVPSIEEAAMDVEKELLERAKKIASMKKLASQQAAADLAEKKTLVPQKTQSPTLSNRLETTAQTKPFTANQRRQRAILIAQGIDPDTGQKKI